MYENEIMVGVEHLEYPFVRKGMTCKEFDEELLYLGKHYDEYKKGTYIPLWKQKEK